MLHFGGKFGLKSVLTILGVTWLSQHRLRFYFFILVSATHPQSTSPAPGIWVIDGFSWSAWWYGLTLVSHNFKNYLQGLDLLSKPEGGRRLILMNLTKLQRWLVLSLGGLQVRSTSYIFLCFFFIGHDSNYDHSSRPVWTQNKNILSFCLQCSKL